MGSAPSPGTALTACPTVERRRLGARASAPPRRTYLFDGGALAVCIDRTMYPYSPGHGHRLLTTFTLRVGADEQSFRGEGNAVAHFHGYDVHIGLEQPEFSKEPEVWLEVDNRSAGVGL